MHLYLAVIEKADGTYSAYSPDLGCVATGGTRGEAGERMREAIAFQPRGSPRGRPSPPRFADRRCVRLGVSDVARDRAGPRSFSDSLRPRRRVRGTATTAGQIVHDCNDDAERLCRCRHRRLGLSCSRPLRPRFDSRRGWYTLKTGSIVAGCD